MKNTIINPNIYKNIPDNTYLKQKDLSEKK